METFRNIPALVLLIFFAFTFADFAARNWLPIYSGGGGQFSSHLKNQGINTAYQSDISNIMIDEAKANDCRYRPSDYWGLLDADYLRDFLGDQISVMEDFVQTYDHRGFKRMRKVTKRIGANTYVFKHSLRMGGCD